MKTNTGEHITPMQAAKRAYVMLGEQASCDFDEAATCAGVVEAEKRELIAFGRHLKTIADRVRKYLKV